MALVALVWGVSLLIAGIGFIMHKLKPTPEPSGIMGMPIFAWIMIILLILILLRRK